MGREASATVRIDGVAAACKVLLEPGMLICRGGHKRTFSHDGMKKLAASTNELTFTCEGREVSISLPDAGAWLEAIKHPRSRAQKLGVAPGAKVVVLARPASEDLSDLAEALGAEPSRRLSAGVDVVLCFAGAPSDLDRLSEIEPRLAPRGAVWLLWPKGRRDFAHEHVVAAAKRAGLVQTKSVGFSAAFSGLRLVRPATKK